MISARSRLFALDFIAVLSLAWLSPGSVQAQKGGGKKDKKDPSIGFTRVHPTFLAAFREVVAPAAKSTVRILCDDKETALGFIVSADGWIVTKAHDLKGAITCKVGNDKSYEAKLVGVNGQHDMDLLKIEAKDLTPMQLGNSLPTRVGHWVASVGTGADPVAIGVVSVATRDLPNKGGPIAPAIVANAGYLGVQLDQDFAGVKISQVLPKTPAAAIGLKANDIILALQGKTVADADAFMLLMQGQRAGDVVILKIKRGDEELELKPKLDKRQAGRGDVQNSMGSELSSRRSGYPTILQHDSVVKPVDCGGPIVDLEGRVIGMNVCRAGRVESWAVPAEVIRLLLPDMKEGRFPPEKNLEPKPKKDEPKKDEPKKDEPKK